MNSLQFLRLVFVTVGLLDSLYFWPIGDECVIHSE